MKDRYVFPAIFDYGEDGISIEFPDLPGCLPCAENEEEALLNAKEALGLHLWGMEKDGEKIPDPTPITQIQHGPNQAVVLIDVWMPPIRHRMANKSVNTTVTLPQWLKEAAEEHKINLSQTLQRALKQELGWRDGP